ncbi:TniB family NTP-binding protein [Mycobacterium marseillense]|uniref:TniB family NTP-binding protein n=1 Tax=Mycobacterium marseillense TaxID=701042 RepID=UPI0011A0BCA2|nr:TniB family NTP-binding protein [Mycobacterium marseillense]
MDAQLWHDYCVSAPPTEPERLTIRQWTNMSDLQRCNHIDQLEAWFQQAFVRTDELAAITRALTDTVRKNASRPPGAKAVLALTGPNCIGKSTLMTRWARSMYLEWIQGADRDDRGRPVIRPADGYEDDLCPVIWIDAPARTDIPKLDAKILMYLGLPGDGRTRELSPKAMSAARRHGGRVVIVDDTHLLYLDWKGGRAVLDHVKNVNTELGQIGATLTLTGANLEDGELVNDPQIAARLKLLRMPEYGIDGIEQQRVWQSIVHQLEVLALPHLPRGKSGMLFTELAGELWLRTQGFLGDLTQLVVDATLMAIKDESFRIRFKHLDCVTLSDRAEKEYLVRTGREHRAH